MPIKELATLKLEMNQWLTSFGSGSAAPGQAAEALSDYLLTGEAILSQLPEKDKRDPNQQEVADTIHRNSRNARATFMRSHAAWTYDLLTCNRTLRPELNEVIDAAAARFPGLVPTRVQMERESQCIQRNKEAREIDQGIFFAAIFSEPQSGIHLLESMRMPSARALSLLDRFRQIGSLRLDTIHIERVGTTAHLTVHNEACLNAEDDQLIADMEVAVDLVLLVADIRVGILRGAPMTHPKYIGKRVFSAGINLKLLQSGQISYIDFLLRRETGYISKILRGLYIKNQHLEWDPPTMEKAWVAAVDTFAIGGGAQILLVVDHVIAASDSYFSLPAAKEGIIPGVANLRLTQAGGSRAARQIILSGRKLFAKDADARMVFDEVVDPSEMDAAINAAAARLNSAAVIANRRMLVASDEPLERFRNYMAEFALEQARRLYSSDVLDRIDRA